MSYTALAILAVAAVTGVDVVVLRTRLLTRRVFWVSYAILLFFQLVTNAVLAGTGTVRYDGAAILGSAQVPFLGEGRLAYAPVEDLLFGFAMVLLTLSLWIFAGRPARDR